MRTKITLSILAVTLIAVAIFFGCKKPQSNEENVVGLPLSQEQLMNIENDVTSIFEFKKKLILNFEDRDKITMKDVFYSDEVKNAVRYQFLNFAELGTVKSYSHDIQIINDEVFARQNGDVVVPAVEKISSFSVDPNTNEKVESAYSDKYFFNFTKKDGQWKLTGIEMLTPEYEMDTKYSIEKVFPFTIMDSEMQQKSMTSEDSRIMYEVRKIWEQYFDKKIDLNTFDNQLHSLYEQNNLLPSQQKQSKSQPILNRTNAVVQAAYTSNSSGTSSYDNAHYKVFDSSKDCANFVSQCLKAGGWQYASPYTNSSSPTAWWYNTKNTSTKSDDECSSAWCNANNLCNYVCVNNNYATFTTPNLVYAGTVGLADLIWTPAWGIKTHVMIVTKIEHPTPNTTTVKYSAHTTNRLNQPWTGYSSNTNATFGHFNG